MISIQRHKTRMQFTIFVAMFFLATSCVPCPPNDDLVAKIHKNYDVIFQAGAMIGAAIAEQHPNEITNNAQVADIALSVFHKFQADPQSAQWTAEKLRLEINIAMFPPQTNFLWLEIPYATNVLRTNVILVETNVVLWIKTNKVTSAKQKSEATK